MRARLEVVIAIVAMAYLGFILVLVRRRQLREKYALLWLGVGLAAILLSLARTVLDRVAHSLGIAYGPSALFLFSTMFLMAVSAHLSWEVSRLEEKTRRLAEEIALLRPQRPIVPVVDLAAKENEIRPNGAGQEDGERMMHPGRGSVSTQQ